MALTNRLRTQGTANLIAAADGARVIAQGIAYAYDPAGSPVKDEDAPLRRNPPRQFAPAVAAAAEHGGQGVAQHCRRPAHPGPRLAARDGRVARRPAPRHVPAWLARLFVGGWGVAYMTRLAGASNLRARERLDWKPTYGNWRDGLAADLAVRAPR